MNGVVTCCHPKMQQAITGFLRDVRDLFGVCTLDFAKACPLLPHPLLFHPDEVLGMGQKLFQCISSVTSIDNMYLSSRSGDNIGHSKEGCQRGVFHV